MHNIYSTFESKYEQHSSSAIFCRSCIQLLHQEYYKNFLMRIQQVNIKDTLVTCPSYVYNINLNQSDSNVENALQSLDSHDIYLSFQILPPSINTKLDKLELLIHDYQLLNYTSEINNYDLILCPPQPSFGVYNNHYYTIFETIQSNLDENKLINILKKIDLSEIYAANSVEGKSIEELDYILL